MADYVVRLTGQDNLSSTIKNVKSAVSDLGNTASTSLNKFTDKFNKIQNSTAPLKRQLRDLRAIMAEMNFKGLSGTDEFTKIAQYAGQVKDAMDDASAATRRFADDTFALKAAADTMTVVTGAFTAATGAMNLFGIKNEEVKNAILKVQSAMAILNGVQAIANALNKDSALMQALKAMRMKISTAVANANTTAIKANTVAEKVSMATTQQDTAAKAANTVAETVNGTVTKRGTIIQQAWNIAKAVAKALVGDFTGLLIVGAGALATYAIATANSTDEIEGQSKALKDNNGAADLNTRWKERLKKSEQEWSDAVTQNASNQIAQYTKLQLKWLECNRDQKTREKFQREYGDEVNRVAGKVKKLSEYEDFFVRDTDKVVEAILARAAAEAGAQEYAKAMLRKAENDRNGTVANGRYYRNAHAGTAFNDLSPEEQAYLKRVGGANASQNPYLQYHAGWSSYWEINEAGAKQVEQFRQNVAREIRAQDDAEIDFWKNWTIEQNRTTAEAERAAGMGVGGGGSNYNPPKAYSGTGGRHGSSGSSGSHGSSGTDKKPEQEVKPLAQSLEWMRQQLSELQKQLSYGLIPADKIEETKSKIDYLKKSIEAKEIELGFKVVPIEGSLDWMEEQLSKLKSDLEKGLIADSDLEAAQLKIENWEDKIQQKKIQLGFEVAPETDYEQSEKQRNTQLNEYKDYLHHITKYARDNDEFLRNQKGYEEYLEKLRQVEEAEEDLSDTTPVATESQERMAAELQNLTRLFQEGAITIDEYNDRYDELSKTLNNLDEVVTTAFRKLEAPKIFDLGQIPRMYEDAIAAIDKMLKEDELSVDARIRLNETKQTLQQKADEIVHGSLSIKAEIKPEYIQQGSTDDMRASYENAANIINRIADDYESGIIKSSGEAKRQIAEVNKQLKELGLKPIVIEIKTEGQKALENIQMYLSGFAGSITSTVDSFEQLARSIDEGANGWEIFKNILSTTETVLTSISTVMQLVNTLTAAHTAVATADAAATTADAAASMGAAAAKSGEATATAGVAVAETAAQNSKMGPFGWVMAIAGAVALAATLFSLIGKFAGGGIVGGNSYSGDKLIARVNSGEMILNQRQQRNLFNAIDSNRLGSESGQTVSFRLKGADIYGALSNYQKIKGKSGVTTGII